MLFRPVRGTACNNALNNGAVLNLGRQPTTFYTITKLSTSGFLSISLNTKENSMWGEGHGEAEYN